MYTNNYKNAIIFGLPESREEYIQDSVRRPFFCARTNDKNIGFLYLKQTGKDTVEIAAMGVLKEYHRKGIGQSLFEYAKKEIHKKGYSFIQVKTVQMGKYKTMTKQINFIYLLASKSLRSFQPYGINGIPVRYTSWQYSTSLKNAACNEKNRQPSFLSYLVLYLCSVAFAYI